MEQTTHISFNPVDLANIFCMFLSRNNKVSGL